MNVHSCPLGVGGWSKEDKSILFNPKKYLFIPVNTTLTICSEFCQFAPHGTQCFTCLKSIGRSFLGQREKKCQKISASFAHAQALIFDTFFLVDPKMNALW